MVVKTGIKGMHIFFLFMCIYCFNTFFCTVPNDEVICCGYTFSDYVYVIAIVQEVCDFVHILFLKMLIILHVL